MTSYDIHFLACDITLEVETIAQKQSKMDLSCQKPPYILNFVVVVF